MVKPEKVPEWLTTEITYLLPKLGDSKEVRNYRPIMFLTTMYKTLIGIIAKIIYTRLAEQNWLPAEQKWCYPGSKECKDQPMISKAIYDGQQEKEQEFKYSWFPKSISQSSSYLGRKVNRTGRSEK